MGQKEDGMKVRVGLWEGRKEGGKVMLGLWEEGRKVRLGWG